jgi:CheY-like chemotaxis protein
MLKKLPLFYFPPTICWIDDDQLFLDAASNLFKNDYNCLTFANPEKAIQLLNTYQPLSKSVNFYREYAESDFFNTYNHLPIDINISEITKLATIPSIRNELAILIIDNNMPNINGIELCKKFKNSPYKKILLTGQTNSAQVIHAFNDGIIDKFIGKDKYLTDRLKKDIFELSYQYFFEQTKNILDHIETSQPSPLSDEIFIDFFYKWCESNQFDEFYLVNKYGSFLVKHKNGSLTYFIVMSEHAKNEFLKFNDDGLDKVGDILDRISAGKLIPFFGIDKEYWEFSYEDWHKYLYPANIIEGREKYYWTTINKTE